MIVALQTHRHFVRSSRKASLPLVIPHAAGFERDSVLKWWRTRPPLHFCQVDADILRRAVSGSVRPSETDWRNGITAELTTAIGVAIDRMKEREISHPDIDVALSAVLAFAIEGDDTAGIIIASGLRRRAYLDPCCRRLSKLWLSIEGLTYS
ncbi:hypothetical protein [Tardiphaga sp. 367_B4_N1_1]|uniref:hypothetical protein n=1 Tax=unclassified Tardiphaga TaxID=2631404 RepID=UPI003F1E9CB5